MRHGVPVITYSRRAGPRKGCVLFCASPSGRIVDYELRWCAEAAIAQLHLHAKGDGPPVAAAALKLGEVASVRAATDEDPLQPGFMATGTLRAWCNVRSAARCFSLVTKVRGTERPRFAPLRMCVPARSDAALLALIRAHHTKGAADYGNREGKDDDEDVATKTDAARSPAPSKGMSRTVDFELTEEISSDYYVNSAMHADFLVRGLRRLLLEHERATTGARGGGTASAAAEDSWVFSGSAASEGGAGGAPAIADDASAGGSAEPPASDAGNNGTNTRSKGDGGKRVVKLLSSFGRSGSVGRKPAASAAAPGAPAASGTGTAASAPGKKEHKPPMMARTNI